MESLHSGMFANLFNFLLQKNDKISRVFITLWLSHSQTRDLEALPSHNASTLREKNIFKLVRTYMQCADKKRRFELIQIYLVKNENAENASE